MDAPKSASPAALLWRLTWMLFGPLMLFLSALFVFRARGSFPAGPDLAYLAVLGVTLLARYLDFRGGDPLTATGEPATPGHLRRYLLVAGFLGVALWAGLHLLAAL
jgi:hypothetical protein